MNHEKNWIDDIFSLFTGGPNNCATSICPEPVNNDDKTSNDEFQNEALEEKCDEDQISDILKYIHLNFLSLGALNSCNKSVWGHLLTWFIHCPLTYTSFVWDFFSSFPDNDFSLTPFKVPVFTV